MADRLSEERSTKDRTENGQSGAQWFLQGTLAKRDPEYTGSRHSQNAWVLVPTNVPTKQENRGGERERHRGKEKKSGKSH